MKGVTSLVSMLPAIIAFIIGAGIILTIIINIFSPEIFRSVSSWFYGLLGFSSSIFS